MLTVVPYTVNIINSISETLNIGISPESIG